MAYRGADQFRTDPTGSLARGAPGGMSGSPLGAFSVGNVGIGQSGPAFRTTGTGPGITFSMPIGKEDYNPKRPQAQRKGGAIKKMAKGGSTASKRADGCATKGKTKGRFV